ncbi:MAG: hypothetical protein RLZZ504_1872 [Bacteroidota bacterium]
MSMDPVVESQLKSLEAQLGELNDFLMEVSADMVDGGFTEHPMYVAHQEQAKIGEMIVDRDEFGFSYSINATTLERFLELGILQKERLGAFLKAYGNPKQKCCVFLMVAPEPQFIFHNFKTGGAAVGTSSAAAAQ